MASGRSTHISVALGNADEIPVLNWKKAEKILNAELDFETREKLKLDVAIFAGLSPRPSHRQNVDKLTAQVETWQKQTAKLRRRLHPNKHFPPPNFHGVLTREQIKRNYFDSLEDLDSVGFLVSIMDGSIASARLTISELLTTDIRILNRSDLWLIWAALLRKDLEKQLPLNTKVPESFVQFLMWIQESLPNPYSRDPKTAGAVRQKIKAAVEACFPNSRPTLRLALAYGSIGLPDDAAKSKNKRISKAAALIGKLSLAGSDGR